MDLKSRTSASEDLHGLIESIAELALEKLDPIKKAERSMYSKVKKANADASAGTCAPAPVRVKSRYIPSTVRHAVYMRDRGVCRNCGASRFVEVDHIRPFAAGGEHALENLRLLCRQCNQRHAIEVYGQSKMESFLRSAIRCYN